MTSAPVIPKKILLAVDDSQYSRQAVSYAVNLSAMVNELHYVLFHVQPVISQFLLDDAKKKAKAQAELDKLKQKSQDRGQQLLSAHKEEMIRRGIPESRIELISQSRTEGVAGDILAVAEKNRYDAILLGRRGVSFLLDTFMGSVAASLVENSRVIPVWVVDGDVSADRIMLAADGSESSLRAVDHLAFMLSGNSAVTITLLHVRPKVQDFCEIDFEQDAASVEDVVAQGAKRCIDQFYAHARKLFAEAGIAERQLEIKTVDRLYNVAKTILTEAQTGKYGTVVIGRRGLEKSSFLGSISRYVVNKISNAALWLVP
jgi:nucleotide-binding universal stress UspA family protein